MSVDGNQPMASFEIEVNEVLIHPALIALRDAEQAQ
jgi:hypothetical protein